MEVLIYLHNIQKYNITDECRIHLNLHKECRQKSVKLQNETVIINYNKKSMIGLFLQFKEIS